MQRRHFLQTSFTKGLGILLAPNLLKGNLTPDFHLDQVEIIDTHLHLWDLQKLHYPWLENRNSPISRNFLISDFKEATEKLLVKKMVFVECGRAPEQYLQEVDWVIEKSKEDKRIKGMVAFLPLEKGQKIIPEMEELITRSIVRGIRCGVNKEVIENADFIKGLQLLPKYHLCFDLNVSPALLPQAISLVKKCPDTTFILDHLANPNIKDNEFSFWKNNITRLAELENVKCKVSGIITKAAPDWKPDDLKPYVDYALQVFSINRVMFGGDWPVVLLAGSYKDWYSALVSVVSGLNPDEKKKLFYANAERFYRI
ncbi:amidohydrolase [soil metagenome]